MVKTCYMPILKGLNYEVQRRRHQILYHYEFIFIVGWGFENAKPPLIIDKRTLLM